MYQRVAGDSHRFLARLSARFKGLATVLPWLKCHEASVGFGCRDSNRDSQNKKETGVLGLGFGPNFEGTSG